MADISTQMQDICVELKQEDFTTYEHPNPRITALRNKLWTGERLAEQPLGSRVPPPIPIRPGPAQIEWQQLINLLGPLPAPLADAHNDVLNALASLDSRLHVLVIMSSKCILLTHLLSLQGLRIQRQE